MNRISSKALAFSVCFCAAAVLFAQQEWKTLTNLPSVDFKGLTPERTNAALKVLRERDCPCGCGMKVAECRVKDPSCSYSLGISGILVDSLKAGKSITAAVAAAEASRWVHMPEKKLLDDPVTLPVAGAPVLGPANARITLVEFSDFQCPYCIKAAGNLKTIMHAFPNDVKLIFKMHDAMFAHREDLSPKALFAIAGQLGLDMQRFSADVISADTKAVVARDQKDGVKAGVDATPTVFVNGRRFNGSLNLDAIRPILEAELKTPAKKK
jgi:protein-disulfide isomerase